MLCGASKNVTVMGAEFRVFSDFISRGTYAVNEKTGEMKQIHWNGYVSKDLTVRKEIAEAFGLPSFRK